MMPQEQQLLRQLIERFNRLERRVTLLDAQEGGGAVDSVNGNTGVVVLDSDDIAEGVTNLYLTQERVEDYVAALLAVNTGLIDATYNDTTGAITLTLDVSAADKMLYSTAADTWAETTLTSFMRTVLDDTSAALARGTLGLAIGVDVQGYDAELAALAGLTSAADRLPYFSGSGTAALATFTSAARNLLDDADATAMRSTLGLGTMATEVATAYALLAGRAGGQTLIGGTGSGDDLTLQSTNHATKGTIFLGSASAYDEVNDRLGIGRTNPAEKLNISGTLAAVLVQYPSNTSIYIVALTAGNGAGILGATTNDDVILGQGTPSSYTEMVRLDVSTQRLGIGLATPAAKLSVLQGTLGSEVLRLESTATNDDPRESVVQARAATTNATTTSLWTYTLPASTTLIIEATVAARRTGGTGGTAEDGAGYRMIGVWKNAAGTATQIGSSVTVIGESQAAWSATWFESADQIYLDVTGAVNNNVTWHATIRMWQVSS